MQANPSKKIRPKTEVIIRQAQSSNQQYKKINLANVKSIIEEIERSQKEKLHLDDENGILDILKAKDKYILDMENSLYSSWAFDRLRITGRNFKFLYFLQKFLTFFIL